MDDTGKSYREIGDEIMAGGGTGGGGGGADLDHYRQMFEEAKAEIDAEYGDEGGTDQYWADVTNAAIDKVDWSEVGNLSGEEVRALTGMEDDTDPTWDGYDDLSPDERTTFLEEIASGRPGGGVADAEQDPEDAADDMMQREGGDTNMPDQPMLPGSGQGGGGGGPADLDKSYYEIGNDILRQQEGDPLQRAPQKTRGDQNRYRVMGEEDRVKKLGNNARQKRYRAVKEKVGPMKAPVQK